jgi:sugar transferase (PEP-CTERM/EpsH1 system associated)
MRILFLTSRFPHPLDKGDKLRAYHQIARLSARHEVVLAALSDQTVSPEDRQALEALCSRVEVLQFSPLAGRLRACLALAGTTPLQVAYFFHRDMARTVARIVTETRPEHVVCQLIRTARYAEGLELPTTLDFMDAFAWGLDQRVPTASPFMAPILRLEARRIRRFERACSRSFDHLTVISDPDAEQLDVPDRTRLVVVPNGVDPDQFSPRTDGEADNDLLFVGNMAYPPNVAAAQRLVREILPAIRRHRPGTSLTIAGASPTAAVRALAGDGVRITGRVDDMAPWYHRSRVFIAPMTFGTGLQNKLLQAMATGVPCVTTSVAARSLESAREGLVVADSSADLADACRSFLDDPTSATAIATTALDIVRRRYTWMDAVEPLEALISNPPPSLRSTAE